MAEEDEGITGQALNQRVAKSIISMLDDADDYSGEIRGRMVLDAAYAYRALKGGAQPGSSVIDR